MPIRLYPKGLENAQKLIHEGKIDPKHEKIDHHSPHEAINGFLKDHSIQEYGLWCLATNNHAPQTSPEHYLYLYGDFHNVGRALLIDIEKEAAKNRHFDVVQAAQELLKRIDKK